MNQNELYWAAGFFDGEGCIRSGPQSTGDRLPQFALEITQVRREPLDRFQKAVGEGSVYGPRKTSHQPQYRYGLSSRNSVKRVANLLLPLVSRPKQEQIERVLEIERSNPARHQWADKPEVISHEGER